MASLIYNNFARKTDFIADEVGFSSEKLSISSEIDKLRYGIFLNLVSVHQPGLGISINKVDIRFLF